jgi:AbrB family looped-hinge helix DNA binding protein
MEEPSMADLATTRLSSRGQVVIPEEVRTALGLEPGARFVVLSDGDVVIPKRIDAPSRSEIRALAARARGQARRAGVKRVEVRNAIRDVRRRG